MGLDIVNSFQSSMWRLNLRISRQHCTPVWNVSAKGKQLDCIVGLVFGFVRSLWHCMYQWLLMSDNLLLLSCSCNPGWALFSVGPDTQGIRQSVGMFGRHLHPLQPLPANSYSGVKARFAGWLVVESVSNQQAISSSCCWYTIADFVDILTSSLSCLHVLS